MRRFVMLAALMVAVPMASWASSSIDFQNFHGKAYFGAGVISTRSIGSNYSSVQGLGRGLGSKNAASVALAKMVFTTGKLNGSLLKGGTFATGGSGYIALPVPEPGTLSLLGIGLVGLAGVVRRRLHT